MDLTLIMKRKSQEKIMSKTVAKPAVMTVTRQFYEGKRLVDEDDERKVLDILKFETDHVSSSSVKLGLTVNLKNYESCRADVMVTVPHYEEERNDAFLYAVDQVETKLQLLFGDKKEANILVARARKAMGK